MTISTRSLSEEEVDDLVAQAVVADYLNEGGSDDQCLNPTPNG
jgi:hypothetical protein